MDAVVEEASVSRSMRFWRPQFCPHLSEGALMLYDVTNSSHDNRRRPLSQFDHNREGENDLPVIAHAALR